jgi:ATP-binding cassette, subfamily B (MDR/TAP), member 1
VERFYDPISGAVKLDGQDIKDLNIKWLRSQIGLVSQEPTLFATTIEGNVAHGLIGTEWETASQEEKRRLVKAACIKANADGFISNLPEGYLTMVGERGFLLSGGQKREYGDHDAMKSFTTLFVKNALRLHEQLYLTLGYCSWTKRQVH